MDRSNPRVLAGIALSACLLAMLSWALPAPACTFVSMARPGNALAGCNEDYINLPTKIWFFPAAAKAHGRIIWGYDRDFAPYQGGMNDEGLFMDINAVAFTGWKDDPQGSSIEDDGADVIEYILTHFATVDEVSEFFRRDDIDLGYAVYVFADARGKSAIIEWALGRRQVLTRENGYQLAFNNLHSLCLLPDGYPDERYRIADRILRGQETPSVGLLRRVLSAVCQESHFNQTLYSTLCDLANRKVYLYHFHNFEEAVVFDLEQELKKGEASHSLPGLFQVRPYSEIVHKNTGQLIPYQEWQKIIEEKGIAEGIESFRRMKAVTRTYRRFIFDDWVIKNVGLHCLAGGRLEEAIAVFKLNTEENPGSGDAYADLAAAYVKKGDRQLAIENYEKALAKSPGNKRIEAALKVLGREGKGQ